MCSSTEPLAQDHGLKYPDRQSLSGSADRNVPVLMREIGPVLSHRATAIGSSQTPLRVLEIAAGEGKFASALAKQWDDSKQHATYCATEGDQELVRRLQSSFAGLGRTGGLALSASLLEIDDPKDWQSISGEESGSFEMAIIVNLLHIAPWSTVENLWTQLAQVIKPSGAVCVYGAFNEDGEFTSEGNKEFNADLRSRDLRYGLRDLQREVIPLASSRGFDLEAVRKVEAGNVFLVFNRKDDGGQIN